MERLCSAILLAGGQSRRMGRNKALLPLPGHKHVTFVAHLAALLRSACPEVILVARNAEQAAEYAGVTDVRLVADVQPGVGPLMGLYSGLRACSCSHALLTAVDMPFVQPAMIAFLLAQPYDEAIVMPLVNGAPQVLLARYPRALLPLIEQRLEAGQRGPRSLLTVAPVRYIEEAQLRAIESDLRSFVNVNTPQELASLAHDQP
jgi:molybdopterin-guanine dinucleotide biosynthesis protein A